MGIHANAGSVIRLAATGMSNSLGGYLDNITLETAGPRTTVPEPASWALMIMGFGGMGAMMRRRRTATASI